MSPRLFFTLAEHSADQHAAALFEAIRLQRPGATAQAFAGPAMRAAGVEVLHDTVAKAAMGLRAFARAAELGPLLKRARQLWTQSPPEVVICCDSWTMNKHFARIAKELGLPVLYYIAPQAWASREGRCVELARITERVACILPFEEKFFRDRGVNATFVGHPLFDHLPRVKRRDHVLTLGLCCGSRSSVAKSNLPRLLAVAEQVRATFPDVRLLVPTTANTHGVCETLCQGIGNIELRQDDFDQTAVDCDLCLCVSGTATLHLAAHRVPMIVVYAASPLLWHGVGRWLIKTRTFAVVNLLANEGRDEPGKHIVPEYIPWYGPTAPLAAHVVRMLHSPSEREQQRESLARVAEAIGKPGACAAAAKLAIELAAKSTGG